MRYPEVAETLPDGSELAVYETHSWRGYVSKPAFAQSPNDRQFLINLEPGTVFQYPCGANSPAGRLFLLTGNEGRNGYPVECLNDPKASGHRPPWHSHSLVYAVGRGERKRAWK